MVSLDTNVLIRFIVKDDAGQFQLAAGLINKAKASGQLAFVTTLVVLECEWVLRSAYQLSKVEILAVLAGLLEAGEVNLENDPELEHALELWGQSAANFANCLILAHSRTLGCSTMVTFDKRASKLANCSLLK
ncbi:MAG TPA: type II toxin-antitoxin system VapC family toxin [Duganella sp.]|jgi:predicted nucleic-acid-binding protein